MGAVRLFTPEEADALLPLVRRIVRDVRLAHGRWSEALAHYEVHAANARADWEPPELEASRERVKAEAEQVDRLLRDLADLGVEFRDFELGLVDFPSLRDDRPVWLCWRDGEDRVTHWHGIDDGYAGRQPLDRAILSKVD